MSTEDQRPRQRVDRRSVARFPGRELCSRCWTGWAAAAEGQDGIRAEVAGNLAGDWFARPEGRQGHELIAAGLLILAGVTDRGKVADAMRVGYKWGKGSLQGYDRPTQPAEVRPICGVTLMGPKVPAGCC